MAKCTKDTFGYLGTESLALRAELERLTAALEAMAKAEGAEAVKAARDAARQMAGQAAKLADELSGTAQAATAAASEGRHQLEGAIRDKPWVAVSIAALAGFLLATLVRR